jgi:hypothetical protein
MKEALVRIEGTGTVSLLRSPMLMLTGDCHYGIAIDRHNLEIKTTLR